MANHIVEIRKRLKTLIRQVHTRSYYEDVPDNSTFPYITYELMDSDFDGDSTEIFIFEIDGWDEGPDTLELETIMHNINLIFENSINVINDTLSFRTVLNKRYNINDEDVRIKRRKYEYQLRLIRRGGIAIGT